jgi:hypothetical protein
MLLGKCALVGLGLLLLANTLSLTSDHIVLQRLIQYNVDGVLQSEPYTLRYEDLREWRSMTNEFALNRGLDASQLISFVDSQLKEMGHNHQVVEKDLGHENYRESDVTSSTANAKLMDGGTKIAASHAFGNGEYDRTPLFSTRGQFPIDPRKEIEGLRRWREALTSERNLTGHNQFTMPDSANRRAHKETDMFPNFLKRPRDSADAEEHPRILIYQASSIATGGTVAMRVLHDVLDMLGFPVYMCDEIGIKSFRCDEPRDQDVVVTGKPSQRQ